MVKLSSPFLYPKCICCISPRAWRESFSKSCFHTLLSSVTFLNLSPLWLTLSSFFASLKHADCTLNFVNFLFHVWKLCSGYLLGIMCTNQFSARDSKESTCSFRLLSQNIKCLANGRNWFLTVLEARKLEIKAPADGMPGLDLTCGMVMNSLP